MCTLQRNNYGSGAWGFLKVTNAVFLLSITFHDSHVDEKGFAPIAIPTQAVKFKQNEPLGACYNVLRTESNAKHLNCCRLV